MLEHWGESGYTAISQQQQSDHIYLIVWMSHNKKQDKLIKSLQSPGAAPCPNNTHHPWGISQPIQTLMRQTFNPPNKGYG